MNRVFLVAIALCSCVLGYVQEPKPLRVLFVGNSYTYYNNLPEMVAAIAASAGVRMEVRMVARGGATLQQTWDISEVRQVLHEGPREARWDYVVLQEHSLLGTSYVDGVQQMSDPEPFWDTIRLYDAEIRKVHAKTILYETWARKSDPGQQSGLNHAYLAIAQELNVGLAPVGMAWARVREMEPNYPLHIADGSHPTPAGTYLAACVLTETILGKKPPSIPNKIVGHLIGANELPVTGKMVDLVSLPLERAEFLQRAAAEAVQSLIEGSVVSRTPTNPIRPGLPAGHKPMPNDLTGVWRGKILFYPWPATMELRLNAPGGDHCSGQWNVTSQSGEHKMTGPIDSCRVTETGVAFLVRDYRGITVSESYWAHFTGETLAGWVEFRGLNRSAHMSGSWELRKQR